MLFFFIMYNIFFTSGEAIHSSITKSWDFETIFASFHITKKLANIEIWRDAMQARIWNNRLPRSTHQLHGHHRSLIHSFLLVFVLVKIYLIFQNKKFRHENMRQKKNKSRKNQKLY